MDKGIHAPKEQSPAWIFLEMFKPGVTSAIESGEAYRKRMNQHFAKMMARVSKRFPPQAGASVAAGTEQPKAGPSPDSSPTPEQKESARSSPSASSDAKPTGWKGLQAKEPFEPRMMQWNGKPFAIEEPALCYKGHDLENHSLEDYYPDLHDDWERYIKDVPLDEVENLRVLRLVGGEKTLLIHVMLRDSVPVYPERLESSGETDGWHEGGVVVVDGLRVDVKGIHVEPTDEKVRAKIEAARRARAALTVAAPDKQAGDGPARDTVETSHPAKPPEVATRSDFDWVKQAELVRALHRVLGEDESPDKATLTRAVQKGLIQSNGKSGRKRLLQVDSVKTWLIKKRGMAHDEVQQVVDAVVAEIRMRKQ